jgi:hypothetical protein
LAATTIQQYDRWNAEEEEWNAEEEDGLTVGSLHRDKKKYIVSDKPDTKIHSNKHMKA